jgi:hypothetical protein
LSHGARHRRYAAKSRTACECRKSSSERFGIVVIRGEVVVGEVYACESVSPKRKLPNATLVVESTG